MSRLTWDDVGQHFYETGVKNGVIYVKNNFGYSSGVAWNGLVSVSEKPSGAEPNAVYADDDKYLNMFSIEEFGATIEAYTYPDEFSECDGTAWIALGVRASQQKRKMFALSYKTILGNDVKADEYGYRIHIIYGCTASPTEKSYQSKNDSPEAITFSWEVTTIPISVSDFSFNKTSHIYIDSTKADPERLAVLEDVLYGSDLANARLIMPSEIAAIMGEYVPPVDPVDPNTYINGLPLLDTMEF